MFLRRTNRKKDGKDHRSLQVRLSGLELRRPRLFGNCWLGCEIWRQLGLDEFWQRRLPDGREAVSWAKVLELLVINHLIDPAGEFRVHRQWFLSTAMDELLNIDYAVAEKDRLYRCLDRVLEHKQDLFVWLRGKWADLFQADFEVLLYDLTSTYFEGAMEEHYLLRSNLTGGDPTVLWSRYVQLTQIESVFRSLKSELGIRPIRHQLEHRADAHILVAFLAYCLQVTLKNRLMMHAPELTSSAVMDALATIQMIDVHIPTVDGRWLILPRYTQPEADARLVLGKLKLALPAQPPPRTTADPAIGAAAAAGRQPCFVVKTFP